MQANSEAVGESEDVLMYENYDLENVVTPVNVDVYDRLLREASHNHLKRRYLVNGFKRGFDIKYYNFDIKVRRFAPNLKLTVGTVTDLWNKVMTEVRDKRYAGPYTEPPFKHFIQSPVGLVPKDKGTKTRLIFHLSYPKKGSSVNSGIAHKHCTVQYPNFDQAVEMCRLAGVRCSVAKSDMAWAFQNILLNWKSWPLMLLKAQHMKTGVYYYFIDKALPFGSSISCAIFQDFSDSIAFIVKKRTRKNLVNYLDDYFFASLVEAICDSQVQVFLAICDQIRFPVSLEKTVWGCTLGFWDC